MKNCALNYVVDFAIETDPVQTALKTLKELGVVCLRNTADKAVLNSLFDKTNALLNQPALLGSTGYYMKDCHKKLYEGFLVGSEALTVLLDERIIDICEGYLGEDVLLQEMLIKNDLGDNELYFPMHAHTGFYRVEKKPGPFSTGIMLYTHDTEAGAFCYAPKTHLWDVPHGPDPDKYPPEMRAQIDEAMCRIAGRRGDIVLFDHRGFHGPEQPVTVPRTVFLGGFHSARAHGNKMKTPTAVYVHDLAALSDKQLRVLGIKSSGSIIPKEKFHYFSFPAANPVTFRILKGVADTSFFLTRSKWKTKRLIKTALNDCGIKLARTEGKQEME